MTYSIVARDPETGALGIAVQSCFFAVGTIVPWIRPGVGVIASQAFAEPAYGPRCLDALAGGASAQQALERATASDPGSALRQVTVLAADGSSAAMTGVACVDQAGHVIGDGHVVAANMVISTDVWPAMGSAFTEGSGSFPRRLLAALTAAQAAGGDARGVMSAALIVVSGTSGESWAGRAVDLRVDHSADPVGDLGRLLDAREAYDHFGRASGALTGGVPQDALAEADAGLDRLPDDGNLRFVRAGALLASGDLAGGRAELRALIAHNPGWETILRGYAARNLLQLPESVTVDTLLG